MRFSFSIRSDHFPFFHVIVLVLAFCSTASIAEDTTANKDDEPESKFQFEAPVRLKAADKFIDHGEVWGHCGPVIADVDEDGLSDLVVGDFGGFFTLYRNVGTERKPVYEAPKKLKAGGEVAKVPIY